MEEEQLMQLKKINRKDKKKTDEILILFAAASRSRLHARLAGLEEKDIVGNDGLR